MNLEFIRGLQVVIIAFLGYVITVTFTGWFESFIAKKMGDDTAEELGFLSLNPLDHFNVFGFAALLWNLFYAHLLPFGIIPAWGRYIPLLPERMRGKHLELRAFVEFTARALGNLLILIGVVIASSLYGVINLHTFHPMTMGVLSISSFHESILHLLLFLYYQNVILFMFHFIFGVFKYIFHFYAPVFQDLSISKIIVGCIILSLALYIFKPILIGFIYIVIDMIQSVILNMRLS